MEKIKSMAARKKVEKKIVKTEKKSYSKQEIITLMHHQTLMIINEAVTDKRVLTMKECDMIAKLGVTIERLENRSSIETIMNVLIEFTKFLCTQDIDFAKKHNAFQDKYITAIIQNENKKS